MDLSFASPHRPQGSDGDPECIFFTLGLYQETFIIDLFDPTAETWVSFQTHRTDGMDGQTDVEVEMII